MVARFATNELKANVVIINPHAKCLESSECQSRYRRTGTRTDKHSKLALRSPYLANVLKQPFFSTEVLSELVDRSEAAHQKIIEQQKAAAVNGDAPPPLPGTPLIRMEVRVCVCIPFRLGQKDVVWCHSSLLLHAPFEPCIRDNMQPLGGRTVCLATRGFHPA